MAAGFLLYFIFEKAFALKNRNRNSLKVIVILGTAFLLMAAEKLEEDHGTNLARPQ